MKGTAVIVNGSMVIDRNLKQFITDNDGAELDVEFVVLNKPEHFLYKYLWGYLMLDMSIFMGEDRDDIHDAMKEKFAKEFVDDWNDVPRRHRKQCRRFELVHDNGAVEKFYIKSTSSMTHEELKEYVQRVEQFYFKFLGGNEDRNIKDGYQLRIKGMMEQKALRKHLKETK